MRAFYLIIANLALPFLLFYLRNIIYKLQGKEIPKLNIKKVVQLFAYGLMLLACVLAYYRFQVEPQARGEFNQVKQYDFR